MLLTSLALALACGQIETDGVGGAGGAPTNGGACSGAEPPPGYETCREDVDCADPLICAHGPFGLSGCGLCTGVAPSDCSADTECSDGNVCVLEADRCACGWIGTCVSACTEGGCGDGEQCDEAGHCQPISCLDGYACPDHYLCSDRQPDEHGCSPALCDAGHVCPAGTVCEPEASGDVHGCRPQRCTEGATCPDNTRCDPESQVGTQCQRISCTVDSECDCGFCISGTCQDRLFVCVQAPIG